MTRRSMHPLLSLLDAFSSLISSLLQLSYPLSNDRSVALMNRNSPLEAMFLQSAMIDCAAFEFRPTMYTLDPGPSVPWWATRARMVHSPIPLIPPTNATRSSLFFTKEALIARVKSRETMLVNRERNLEIFNDTKRDSVFRMRPLPSTFSSCSQLATFSFPSLPSLV